MRIELKESGVKQAMNMKEETILKKYNEMVPALTQIRNIDTKTMFDNANPDKAKLKPPSVQIDITEADKKFFDTIGLKVEWLASIANRYNFNRFQYAAKFKAFRCYQGHNQLDWISVNDLAMLNGKQEITTILLKHQPHTNKSKIIIKLPWRR